MDDLISRQAAISHAISGRTRELEGEKWIRVSEVRESLQTMPSAQPEIIMCKDCKFYDGRPCGIVDYYNTADDYCSHAERKEE